jgi:D-proline reductase (dithiol) PrdB
VSDYVRYIDRTRDYYLAEGYEKPYQWAHFETVPFARLTKPLAECCVTIVSTSGMRSRSGNLREAEEQHGAGFAASTYSIPSDFPIDDLFTDRMGYDRFATHLDDVGSYFPLAQLRRAAATGRVGAVAARCHGVRENYSQRRTSTIDAPTVLERCLEDGVDVALLVPV